MTKFGSRPQLSERTVKQIQFGVTNLLEAHLSPELYNNFLEHGCWCARFNSEKDQQILGGSKTIDLDTDGIEDDYGLDQLCKNWITSRRCNKLQGGSCQNEVEINPYSIDLSSLTNHTCLDEIQSCLSDNCEIDAYFALEIFDLITQNGVNLMVAEEGDCRYSAFTNFGPAPKFGRHFSRLALRARFMGQF